MLEAYRSRFRLKTLAALKSQLEFGCQHEPIRCTRSGALLNSAFVSALEETIAEKERALAWGSVLGNVQPLSNAAKAQEAAQVAADRAKTMREGWEASEVKYVCGNTGVQDLDRVLANDMEKLAVWRAEQRADEAAEEAEIAVCLAYLGHD